MAPNCDYSPVLSLFNTGFSEMIYFFSFFSSSIANSGKFLTYLGTLNVDRTRAK
jgi:hypothetical protein